MTSVLCARRWGGVIVAPVRRRQTGRGAGSGPVPRGAGADAQAATTRYPSGVRRLVILLLMLLVAAALGVLLVTASLAEPPGVAATPTPSAAAGVLVGAGDIAECPTDHDEATAALLDEVVAEHPHAVVYTTGDNAYPHGTYENLMECYDPSWGRHKERTRPAVGNHDFGERQGAGHHRYWGDAGGPFDRYYYTYELAGWQVVVLNSECHRVGCTFDSDDGDQVEWLVDQLESSDARCTLAIWHNPRWSSGRYGNDPEYATFWEVLYGHGAEVVLNGHEHLYERFEPMRPDGEADEAGGIRQFTVGTGGGNLRDFEEVEPTSAARASEHGVLKLTLEADRYAWEFLSVDPEGFTDAGSGTCH